MPLIALADGAPTIGTLPFLPLICVTEIAWSGGKLPDAWYDEFTFQGFIAGDLEAGRTIHFPVVQECEKGVHRWIEIPAEGKTPADLPEPAPGVKLIPASAPRH